MRLFIGRSILKRELGGELSVEIRELFRRALKSELLIEIKGSALPARSRLLKAYATSRLGARRIVCLLLVEKDDLFLLFFRPKGDPIGDNISIKNPAFKTALAKHLSLLQNDIAHGQVEECAGLTAGPPGPHPERDARHPRSAVAPPSKPSRSYPRPGG